MPDPVWIKGSYDRLLLTLGEWYRRYDEGKVVTYRKIFNGTEEFVGIQATERALQVPFSDEQFRILVEVMSILYPNSTEARYFDEFYKRTFYKCKKIKGSIRLVTMSLPKIVVENLVRIFLDFRDGKIIWKSRMYEDFEPDILEEGTTESRGLFAELEEEDDE